MHSKKTRSMYQSLSRFSHICKIRFFFYSQILLFAQNCSLIKIFFSHTKYAAFVNFRKGIRERKEKGYELYIEITYYYVCVRERMYKSMMNIVLNLSGYNCIY